MSAATEPSNATASSNNPEWLAIEIQEGNWHAYQQHIARPPSDKDLIEHFGSVIKYKRMCALAYMGKRAQHHGGVCSNAHPRIFTEKFVAELAEKNKAQRYARYPWLEKLLNLLDEIERIQDEISNGSSNIISLVPAVPASK